MQWAALRAQVRPPARLHTGAAVQSDQPESQQRPFKGALAVVKNFGLMLTLVVTTFSELTLCDFAQSLP